MISRNFSRQTLWVSLLLFAIGTVSYGQTRSVNDIYDARITEGEILTPEVKPEPKINGPKVYGARPDKKFVYRIPCQGKRPIQFAAQNLPPTLILDAENGIITGRTPSEIDTYTIIFSAKNSIGTDSREFKLVVGDKIALTPPMGWNSWGGHMLRVSDEVIRKATDFIVNNGLADVGFQYISIDDCWMRIDQDFYKNNKDFFEKRELDIDFQEVVGPSRDEYGRIIPNNFFPDMKGMTDYIHSFGLKAGLYSSPGERTCQRYAGSFGYEKIDAKQYADWGFDFLKYDMCSGWYISEAMKKALPKENSFVPEISFWYPMTLHLAEQDRDILYNLCQYGKQSPWEWAPNINIQTWRIRGDLLRNIDTYSDDALLIATDLREYSKPGQWSDPDYLYIDKTSNWKDKSAPPDDIPLSTNQKYQYVSLWSMICAPYFFSFSIDHANDFVIGLMGNADMANVNQDELGHVAEVVRDKNEQLVMAKKMADGAVVVGLFNMNPEEDQIARLKWDEIGLENRHFVRDLWRQKELGSVKEGITVKLSPNGCAILKVY